MDQELNSSFYNKKGNLLAKYNSPTQYYYYTQLQAIIKFLYKVIKYNGK